MSTDKKITELPIATSVSASDVSVLVNSGTDYQYTFTVLLQFLQSNLSTGASISFGTVLPQNTAGKNGDVFVNTSLGSFAQKISGTWTIVYTLPTANAADGTLLYGAGIPGSGSGKNSDSYINTLTGIFYKKSAGAWSQVFSMATGPQGPQGTAGTNGTNGSDGNTILFGITNPSNTLTGVNGNFYINTSTYTLFGPKTAGAWGDSVSLIAPGLPDGGAAGQVLAKVDGTDFNTEWRDNSFATLSGEPGDNTNLAAALDTKQDQLGFIPENIAHKNAANGYAGLDSSGKVAAVQLPSYVDDVLEFADFAALPATGETGKIYVTLDTNAEYRWSGSAYIQIVASPGSTDSITEGTTNLYFTVARVLTTILTGIGFSSTTAVTATDTILAAIGKLQAQITGLFKIPSGGTTGQVLAKVDGTDGNVEWITVTGGSGTPGGTDKQIQFNSSGTFAGSPNLTWDSSNKRLGVGGTANLPFEVKYDGGSDNPSFAARFTNTSPVNGPSPGIVLSGANSTNPNDRNWASAINVFQHGDFAITCSDNSSGDPVLGNPRLSILRNGFVGLGGQTNPQALLQMDSTESGILIPRMTEAQRLAISSPAVGLQVYQTDAGTYGEGVYQYRSTGWASSSGGVAGTDGQIQFNSGGSFAGNSKMTFDPATSVYKVVTKPYDGYQIDATSPYYSGISLLTNGIKYGYIGSGNSNVIGNANDLSIQAINGGRVSIEGAQIYFSGVVNYDNSANYGTGSGGTWAYACYGFGSLKSVNMDFSFSGGTMEMGNAGGVLNSWQNFNDWLFKNSNIGFASSGLTQSDVYAQFMASSKSLIINGGDTAGFTADTSALLQLDNTSRGFLPPRMTTSQKNAISNPAEGLIVYDTTLHKLCIYTGSTWETITSI